MPSFTHQLRLLLRRNYLIKRRAARETLTEVLFPLLFFTILLSLKQANSPQSNSATLNNIATPLTPSSSAWSLSSLLSTLGTLTYYPYNGTALGDVEMIMEHIRTQAGPTHRNSIMGFSSEDELNSYYHEHPENTWAGLLFPDADARTGALPSPHIRFELRVNGSRIPSTSSEFIQFDWQQDEVANDYLHSGFLTLQNAVSQAVLAFQTNDTDVTLDTSVALMPVRKYRVDVFHDLLVNLGGLYFVIGFFPIVQKLVQVLVREKEKRTKEGMKMMGLSGAVFFSGWYISYTILTLIPAALLAFLSVASDFYSYASPFAIFILLALYVQTLIFIAFIISCFFDRAKTAGQLGSLLVFMLFLPNYLIRDGTGTSTITALSISSPIAFSQGMRAIADAEAAQLGIGTDTWSGGPDTKFAFHRALVVLLIDAIVYALAALYFDTVMQGRYGVARHWLYPCLSTNRTVIIPSASSNPPSSSSSSNPSIEDVSVNLQRHAKMQIFGITKVFDSRSCLAMRSSRPDPASQVTALDGVDLTIYEGQITVLLGHNGAGKSTLVSILSGLYPPSQGDAVVYDRSVTEEMHNIRRLLGVCPQHDILFDQLTVREHLAFYAGIKGVPEHLVDQAVTEKIDEVDLADKTNEWVKTLSGGQKRRLSVAIALIGDSKVVFLDEPSSGVDAVSRRRIWSVLQRYKQDRIIILTTHSMLEAETLGDRIAILSRGRLKAVGSSLFLKHRFGLGYNLTMSTAAGTHERHIIEAVQTYVPKASLGKVAGHDVGVVLPLSDVARFPPLFEFLDSPESHDHGILGFGVSLTTLEEVFLSIGHEEEVAALRESTSGLDDVVLSAEPSAHEETALLSDASSASSFGAAEALAAHSRTSYTSSRWRQAQAIIAKRLLITRRNKRGLFFQLVLPLIYIVVLLAVTRGISDASNVHPPRLNLADLSEYDDSYLPYAAATADGKNRSETFFNPLAQDASIHTLPVDVDTDTDLARSILASKHVNYLAAFTQSMPAADDASPTFEWTLRSNQSAMHAAPRLLNLMASLTLQYLTSSTPDDASITVINAPFAYPTPTDEIPAGGVVLAIMMGLAFSYIPITFAVLLVKERECKAKQLQAIMGMSPTVFFTTNLLFDFALTLLPVFATFALFAAFGNDTITGTNALGAFLLFIMYALSVIPLTYFLSTMFDNSSTVQPVLSMVYSLGGVILFVASLTIHFSANSDLGDALVPIFSIVPTFGLSWGLYTLSRDLHNRNSREGECQFDESLCDGVNSVTGTLAMDHLGRILIVMAAVSFVSLLLTILIDQGILKRLWQRIVGSPDASLHSRSPIDVEREEDEDVKRERGRVESTIASGAAMDNITTLGLRKVFALQDEAAGHKVAVDNLTLGIPGGELLACLGPNGAGKSVTMSMLTCELLPTTGDAFVVGENTADGDRSRIYSALGFCPQFDGLLEYLTGREHLYLYGRIKGIPERRLRTLTEEYLDRLKLTPHADKITDSYSGGNKRKLSLALSLIGSPRVLLLDEPTTGVDVAARNAMYEVITGTMANRAVVLTTHSMEEADKLCTRIAILINGRLRCIGSSQHLKSRFGRGYQVEVRTKTDDEQVVAAVREYVAHELSPGAELLESFGTRQRFRLAEQPIGPLFASLEAHRDELNIADYSLSQATLEQIFISFAKEQRPE